MRTMLGLVDVAFLNSKRIMPSGKTSSFEAGAGAGVGAGTGALWEFRVLGERVPEQVPGPE